MISSAQKKYKKKVEKITIEFYLKDSDILEFLKMKGSVQSYLKSLIRREYEQEKM